MKLGIFYRETVWRSCVLPCQVDGDLAREVGDDLARLLAAAKDVARQHDKQALVVRSAPVHRVGSLAFDEADLSAQQNWICSCTAVTRKLREVGSITAEEESRAVSYLALHERKWDNEPEIPDGAELYLDGLSVTYLQEAGMLQKLAGAGFRAIMLPGEEDEASALIAYNARTDEATDIIDKVRTALVNGIDVGKVHVASSPNEVSEKQSLYRLDPTTDVLLAANAVDLLAVDDRFVNQHVQIQNDGGVNAHSYNSGPTASS